MTYKVYEWHFGSNRMLGEDMTVEQVMEMNFTYIKFNKKTGIAWVTNCCDFKMH